MRYATSMHMGKMIRATIATIALVFVCILAFEQGAIDQCDWSGSGNGKDGGVQPVYLRCSRGMVQWNYPRGALRILLSLPNNSGSHDSYTCVKVSGPVRVFVEAGGKLMHLYSSFNKSEHSHRCFYSRKRVKALFMEAEDNDSLKNMTSVKLLYSLDLYSLKGGTLRIPYEEEECRPCSIEELSKAYCESDLVARGTITAIQQQYIDMEAAELMFRVTKLLRQIVEGEINETIDIMTKKNVRVRMPAVCDARHGHGEFVIMAKRRFGDLILVCAPRLEEWAQAVREMNNAPCILKS